MDPPHSRRVKGEGGRYVAWVPFGPDGALMFHLGTSAAGQGDRVLAMHAVRGSNMTNLVAAAGGCGADTDA